MLESFPITLRAFKIQKELQRTDESEAVFYISLLFKQKVFQQENWQKTIIFISLLSRIKREKDPTN